MYILSRGHRPTDHVGHSVHGPKPAYPILRAVEGNISFTESMRYWFRAFSKLILWVGLSKVSTDYECANDKLRVLVVKMLLSNWNLTNKYLLLNKWIIFVFHGTNLKSYGAVYTEIHKQQRMSVNLFGGLVPIEGKQFREPWSPHNLI